MNKSHVDGTLKVLSEVKGEKQRLEAIRLAVAERQTVRKDCKA
jgi:hypothetical protein